MRPPICAVCRRGLECESSDREGLIQFADYRELPEGVCGHPYGLEYFCRRHYKAAVRLSGLNYDDAMVCLRKRYGEPLLDYDLGFLGRLKAGFRRISGAGK